MKLALTGQLPFGGGETLKPDPAPDHVTGARPPAGAVEALLRRGPWRAAIVYAIASGAYGAVMVTGVLLPARLEFFPMRVLLLLVSYAWPIVLTINLVARTVPRTRPWVLGIGSRTGGCGSFLYS